MSAEKPAKVQGHPFPHTRCCSSARRTSEEDEELRQLVSLGKKFPFPHRKQNYKHSDDFLTKRYFKELAGSIIFMNSLYLCTSSLTPKTAIQKNPMGITSPKAQHAGICPNNFCGQPSCKNVEAAKLQVGGGGYFHHISREIRKKNPPPPPPVNMGQSGFHQTNW